MGLLPYKNESYLDWLEEANQAAMRGALEEVGDSLGKSYPLIIGGKPVETDGEIVSLNPSDPSQIVGRVAAATGREADMALETATKTFESWSRATSGWKAFRCRRTVQARYWSIQGRLPPVAPMSRPSGRDIRRCSRSYLPPSATSLRKR